MTQADKWDRGFYTRSPIFQPLQPLFSYFSELEQWPDIDQYAHVFRQFKLPFTPVPQAQHIEAFEDHYEPRIYLKGELQTRTENWHDFFNALVWLSFPETKAALNQLHYKQASQRDAGSNRSLLENRITQFDECGAVIISDRPELLELIRQHRWSELFIDHRDDFDRHIRCLVFGHAIYEKSLAPYIGMTCHCMLLESHSLLDSPDIVADVDEVIAKTWLKDWQKNPGKLQAYPILGTPGFWPNQDEAFYQNAQYFRNRK